MTGVAPPPAEDAQGLLQVVDLPPVTGVRHPWIGTDPTKPTVNPAATPCDRAAFTSRRLRSASTRSFLVPQAKLPDRFGIGQTIGSFRTVQAADEFVATIAQRMGSCEDRRAGRGTDVDLVRRGATKRTDVAVWHQVTEVSDKTSIAYWMAVVRRDRVVSQVTFVPTPGATIGPVGFRNLAERALARLENLPTN
jgi:hypothetical protein